MVTPREPAPTTGEFHKTRLRQTDKNGTNRLHTDRHVGGNTQHVSQQQLPCTDRKHILECNRLVKIHPDMEGMERANDSCLAHDPMPVQYRTEKSRYHPDTEKKHGMTGQSGTGH